MQTKNKHIEIKIDKKAVLIEADRTCMITFKFLHNSTGFIAKKMKTVINEGKTELKITDLRNGQYLLNSFIEDSFYKCIKFSI